VTSSLNHIGSWRKKRPLIEKIFIILNGQRRSTQWGVKWEASWSLRLFCLLGVWNVVCVVRGVCEREELVEFVWNCVVHKHNDVCKQKEHERRLCVKSKRSWSFMEYYRWTSLWTFINIFVPPKSIVVFVSNFNQFLNTSWKHYLQVSTSFEFL
jgi:hypothetical protein